MTDILKRMLGVNLRFALRQFKNFRDLTGRDLGQEFARTAYLEIYTVLRYVYLVLPVVYIPFALYDFWSIFYDPTPGYLIYFNMGFYPVLLAMNLLLNKKFLNRGDLRRLKYICRGGVFILSVSGNLANLMLFYGSGDLSIFVVSLLSIAVIYRFPDRTKYYIYAVNYIMLYGFLFYLGENDPTRIQNPIFVLALILLLDRVSLLTLAARYMEHQRIARLNQLLLEADQNKSDMIGIAIHDLKSPLSGILSVCKLVRERPGDFPETELREILNEIEGSSRSILGKIEDLVSIASTGVMDPGKSDKLDVNSFIHATVQNYNYQASLKNIHFYTRLAHDKPMVFCDPIALAGILDNLVSNAIKYSPPGGNVFVHSRLKPGKIPGENVVQIDVSDEGPGFTPEDREHLFSRFTTLSARPTDDESSTGVGLYAVYRMLEQIGGEITLESEPGQGARFTVGIEAISAAPG